MSILERITEIATNVSIKRRELFILFGLGALYSVLPIRWIQLDAWSSGLHDLLAHLDTYNVGKPNSIGFYRIPVHALRRMSHTILESQTNSVMIRIKLDGQLYIVNAPVQVREEKDGWILARPIQGDKMHTFGHGDILYLDQHNFASIFDSRNTLALRDQFKSLHSKHH